MIRRLARQVMGGWCTLPDYLILGAQKGGTTSLQHDLEAHPQVVPAATKEIHYFDLEYARGDSWYRSHFPASARRRQAARRGRPVCAGDATPYYLFHPLAPRRARRTAPEARLIVLLRDPVERAHSHYHHEVRLGFEDRPFDEALDLEAGRLAGEAERILSEAHYRSLAHQHHSYASRGCYAAQLRAWWEHFPREQTLILTTEELAADPAASYGRVLDFLGLPPWCPPAFSRLNATGRRGMERDVRVRLERFFEPHNQELEALLGRRLGWGRPR